MSLSPQARARLRARFVGSLPERLEVMQAVRSELGHDAPDAPAKARTLGHQFAGTGSSFGFPEISDQGRALEHATPDQLAPALEQLMRVVRDALGHDVACSFPKSVGP